MHSEPKIHGSIFLLLSRFIADRYGPETWTTLLDNAGLKKHAYELHESYPLFEIESIILQASRLTGIAESDLKENFGQHMAADLMKMYLHYLSPEWKTFDILVNTEIVMHKAVRKQEHKANPPILNISRVHDKLLIIDYYSERKMGSLAVGIIKGIAAYFNEEENIKVVPLSNPNDERVQIRVEFI